MNIESLAREFCKEIDTKNIVAITSFEKEKEFLTILVSLLKKDNKEVYFVPVNSRQSKIFFSLNQKLVSLNDKEIDVAFEVADQVDSYNNFVKIRTNSFVRDKMISQSALKLFLYVNANKYVQEINSNVCVEISSFAWQRTVIHLQSFGFAQIVYNEDGSFYKTEIGHYLVKIKLDKNITLDDFEYSVRNVPGVLETGVFLGMADILFVYNEKKDSFEIKTR